MARICSALAAVAVVVGMGIASFPAGAAVSPTNGRIAFERLDPTGNSLIYTANPDGSDERLVFSEVVEQPRWSPNGSEVDVRTSDFSFSATIVNVDTGNVRNLPVPDPIFTCTPTTTPEECENTDFSCQMAWSPDGTRLACVASSGVDPSRNGIYTVRSSDGGGLTLIKSCPPACGPPGDFSPDGKHLVFVGSDENDQLRLYTIKVNGSGLTPLTPAGMELNDEAHGRWSPQGDQLLFAARPAPGHRFALWVVGADGKGLHQVPIPSCGGAFADPTSVGCPQAGWSPDGTKIVFTRVSSMGRQVNIYTVNADGTGLFQVTHNGFLDIYPDWGTHLANK